MQRKLHDLSPGGSGDTDERESAPGKPRMLGEISSVTLQ
jgi:hypothetical protein